MTRFEIQLQGSGIELRGYDRADPEYVIRGFFVNRIVKAGDSSEAVNKATAAVRDEWTSGQFAQYGLSPTLSVSRVQPLGFWAGLTARNSGYIFHPDA
jgi:hypothetical protein